MSLKEDITPFVSALRDATLLLRIAAQGEADLREGRFLPQDEAFARVRSRLKGQ